MPSARRHCRMVVLCTAALLLGGCAAVFKPIEAPKIELAAIGIQKAGFSEAVLQLTLMVTNPNRIPLTMKALTCDLALNGNPVATGISQETVDIPALGRGTVSITVATSAVRIATTLLEALARGTGVDYRLKGDVQLKGGLFMPSAIPFDTRGEVPIRSNLRR